MGLTHEVLVKPIDSRRFTAAKLAATLRNRLGVSFPYAEFIQAVVPNPVLALRRLVKAKAATVEKKYVGGKLRTIVTVADKYPPVKKAQPLYAGQARISKRQYLKKTAVCWVLGQELKPAGSNRTPAIGIESFVKVGAAVHLVRYVGRVPGGWHVTPV